MISKWDLMDLLDKTYEQGHIANDLYHACITEISNLSDAKLLELEKEILEMLKPE